jgi:hypothetical protein
MLKMAHIIHFNSTHHSFYAVTHVKKNGLRSKGQDCQGFKSSHPIQCSGKCSFRISKTISGHSSSLGSSSWSLTYNFGFGFQNSTQLILKSRSYVLTPGVILGSVMVIVLSIGPNVHGFKPG